MGKSTVYAGIMGDRQGSAREKALAMTPKKKG